MNPARPAWIVSLGLIGAVSGGCTTPPPTDAPPPKASAQPASKAREVTSYVVIYVDGMT
ncbi:MAG: hypothetical protein JKY65_31320 [Planctomycetes bacterium]|nr:hypothetical protein [Planctomycetota bacterium]